MNITADYYFDECYMDYESSWSAEHLHLGYWNDDTKSHEESLISNVLEVVRLLDIQKSDHLLDIGCGNGGSCRLIAELSGNRITGITNSRILYDKSISLSNRFKYPDLVKMHLGDFLSNSFKDEVFNKAYAIESTCHFDNKDALLKEIFRILSPGGRLVISDYFLCENISNENYSMIYEDWLKGWGIPGITTPDFYLAIMRKYGYIKLSFCNRTELIKKSCSMMSEKINRFLPSVVTQYVTGETSRIRLENLTAAVKINEFLNQGLWQYGILIAEKPL